MADRYVYPAIFHYAKDGVSVEFPDLPGALTCAEADAEEDEIYRMAKDCLALHLYGMERDGDEIPKPSKVYANQLNSGPGFVEAAALVEVWMPPYRDMIEDKAVKKTVTIPKWLDDLASENKVNFSRILQDGLKDYLGIEERGGSIVWRDRR